MNRRGFIKLLFGGLAGLLVGFRYPTVLQNKLVSQQRCDFMEDRFHPGDRIIINFHNERFLAEIKKCKWVPGKSIEDTLDLDSLRKVKEI